MASQSATREWLKVVLAILAFADCLFLGSLLLPPDQDRTARVDYDVEP